MPINLLVFSNDLALSKNIQMATKLCQVPFVVYPCSNFEKFCEYLDKHKMDAVLVDELFNSVQETKWISDLRSKYGEKLAVDQTSFFLVCQEHNLKQISQILSQGYKDLFVKPIDLTMMLQKLQIYLPKKQFLKENLLFTMGVNSEMEIQIRGKMIRASEFGATILTNRPLGENEVLTVSSEMLTASGSEEKQSSLARVLYSIPHKLSNAYETGITFIGPSKSMLTSIRLWIRKKFIESSENDKGV